MKRMTLIFLLLCGALLVGCIGTAQPSTTAAETPPQAAATTVQPAETRSTPRKADGTKVGRNDPCPCGSGKKYKKCCGFNPNTPDD